MRSGRNTHTSLGVESLSTKTLSGTVKDRKVYQVGWIADDTQFIVHNLNFQNTLRAVQERVFYVKVGDEFRKPPPTDKRTVKQRLSPAWELLKKGARVLRPMSPEAFVQSSLPRRRPIYEAARKSIFEDGNMVVDKDAHVRAFVKAEKIEVSPAKPDPAPRIIQPRAPRYLLRSGMFIRPLEHLIYRSIRDNLFDGEETVVKGLNADQTGELAWKKWNKFIDPVGIDLDASRFDQHVRRAMLEFEHGVYLQYYRGEDRNEFRRLLRMQLRNVCVAVCKDGVIKYKTDGCRMSGDMNTALGNCLLMCSMMYCYSKERGVRIELMNNGDDCFVICERSDYKRFVDKLEQWFTDLGFTMKVGKVVDVFESMDFCKTHPIFVNGHPRMVRTFPTCLNKDLMSLLPIQDKVSLERWFASIGDCGLALCGGVPVYESYYRMIKRWSSGRRGFGDHPHLDSGFMRLAQGMNTSMGVDLNSRISFMKAFGCNPGMQQVLEEFYDRCEFPESLAVHVDSYSKLGLNQWQLRRD